MASSTAAYLPHLVAIGVICTSVCYGAVPVVRFQQDTHRPEPAVVLKALRHAGQTQNLPSQVVQAFKHAALQTVNQDLKATNNSLCSCHGYNCGCCLHLKVETIHLNDRACLNISYLPSELGIEFTVSIDGRILIDDKISVSNPPPICAAIPYVHKLASVCVKFYDLKFKSRQFSGCASLRIMFAGDVIENIDMGCFHIPPNAELPTFEPRIVGNN